MDDAKTLICRALLGESINVDRDRYTLHELTQIAVALTRGATLTLHDAADLTPLERASIETVGKGRIVFR